MPNTRAYSRRRLRYSIVDKIPKQVEYLNRVIAADDVTCVERIRMSKDAFTRLCYLLKHVGGLVPTRSVGVEERVASFLVILAHHSKNRTVKFDFRRSGKTISRGFRCVLHALLKLHHLLLVTPTPVTENQMSEQWRPFKGCLGALDGTYIPVTVPLSDAPHYRNRKGFVSVNVLGVCDRDMRFVHMLNGWEGSASDARVLRDAVTKQSGLKVPQGNYYLVDGGYANSNEFLSPYRSIHYHLKEWESGHLAPQNYKEYFNLGKSRRFWTGEEQRALIDALKLSIIKGYRGENGLKYGHHPFLEEQMKAALPGVTIVADPHIKSMVHVWKRQYVFLSGLLSKSGVNWNPIQKKVECTQESWDEECKAYLPMKNKVHHTWPFYEDWVEIFGKDRATCDNYVNFAQAVNEVLGNEEIDVVNI